MASIKLQEVEDLIREELGEQDKKNWRRDKKKRRERDNKKNRDRFKQEIWGY